jgi:hypothetical protein
MHESYDVQSFEPIETQNLEPRNEVSPKFDQSSTEPTEFPLTRKQCGQYFGVSDVSVGKWCKAIEATGASIGTRGIDRDGFELIKRYYAAPNRQAFLDELTVETASKAIVIHTDSELVLDVDFEELYQSVSSRYEGLSDRETETANQLANTEAELLAEYEALEVSRQKERSALLREAKMRGIQMAIEEKKAEEAAYNATINRLRTEKERKAVNFR